LTRAAHAALVALLGLSSSSDRVAANLVAAQPRAATYRLLHRSAPTSFRIGVLRNGRYEVVSLPIEVYVARVLTGEAARRVRRLARGAGDRHPQPTRLQTAGATAPTGSTCATRPTAR
jgi:hypothetical protein